MTKTNFPEEACRLRFWIEPLGPHTQREPGKEPKRIEHGRQDLCDCLPGFRWVLIFPKAGEIHGFKSEADFRSYCLTRFGVTKWSRDWTGDWTPEDGDSWISNNGDMWPGRVWDFSEDSP